MMRGFEQDIKVKLDQDACRGCQLCVDTCPVEVFTFDELDFVASVDKEENCIGCLSCYYICPSICIDLLNVPLSKKFFASQENLEMVPKFL